LPQEKVTTVILTRSLLPKWPESAILPKSAQGCRRLGYESRAHCCQVKNRPDNLLKDDGNLERMSFCGTKHGGIKLATIKCW
jgi:hypothetical protein